MFLAHKYICSSIFDTKFLTYLEEGNGIDFLNFPYHFHREIFGYILEELFASFPYPLNAQFFMYFNVRN